MPFRGITIFWVGVLLLLPLLPVSAQDARALLRDGKNSYLSGNYVDALNFLQAAIKKDPKLAEAYFNLSLVYRRQQQPKAMIDNLKTAMELDPKNEDYRTEYIKYFDSLYQEGIKRKQTPEVTQKVKKFLKEILLCDSGSWKHLAAYALLCKQANDIDGLLSQVSLSIDKNPSSVNDYQNPSLQEVFVLQGWAHAQQKEWIKAHLAIKRSSHYPNENRYSADLVAEVKNGVQGWLPGLLKDAGELKSKDEGKKALALYKQVLQVDPGNTEAIESVKSLENKGEVTGMLTIANQHQEEGRYPEALEIYERVLQLDPANGVAPVQLEITRRKIKKAQEKLQAEGQTAETVGMRLEEKIKTIDNEFRNGLIEVEQEKYTSARDRFLKVKKLSDKNVNLKDFYDKAVRELAKLEQRADKLGDYNKAKDLYAKDDFQGALDIFERLPQNFAPTAKDPPDVLSYMALAKIRLAQPLSTEDLKQKMVREGQEYGRKQMVLDSKNLRAVFAIGLGYHTIGDFPEAQNYFLKVQEADPTYPEIETLLYQIMLKRYSPLVIPVIFLAVVGWIVSILYQRLPIYRRNSIFNQARKMVRGGFFKEGLELFGQLNISELDEFQKLAFNVDSAVAFRKVGDFNSAIVKAKDALKQDPKNEEAKEVLGWSYLGKQQIIPENVEVLLALYQKEKNNIALVELLSKFFVAAKNTKKEAMEIFDRMLILDPNNLLVLRFMANFYLQSRKQDKKALKVFQTLLELQPQDQEVKLGLARIYLAEDKIEDCINVCNNIMEQDLNNAGVHPIYRDAYKKANQLDLLYGSYEKLLEEHPHNVTLQQAFRDCQKLVATPVSSKKAALSELLQREMNTPQQAEGNADGGQPPTDEDSPFSTPAPRREEARSAETPFSDPGGEVTGGDSASGGGEGEVGNTVQCKSCRYMNSRGDYYCQSCGQPMG